MLNRFHFLTRWRFRATAEEVFDILSQPEEYPRWWPSVYIAVKPVGGNPKHLRLWTKGWLPYTLRWEALEEQSEKPNRIVIRATGDFDGRGVWSLVQDGEFVDVSFDWRLNADKPVLRTLSPLLRPAFEANHRWAMAQGEKSLALELERYRAKDAEDSNAIATPPGADTHSLSILLGGAGAVAGTILCAALQKKERARIARLFHPTTHPAQ